MTGEPKSSSTIAIICEDAYGKLRQLEVRARTRSNVDTDYFESLLAASRELRKAAREVRLYSESIRDKQRA